jgi:hypothetical protein
MPAPSNTNVTAFADKERRENHREEKDPDSVEFNITAEIELFPSAARR